MRLILDICIAGVMKTEHLHIHLDFLAMLKVVQQQRNFDAEFYWRCSVEYSMEFPENIEKQKGL